MSDPQPPLAGLRIGFLGKGGSGKSSAIVLDFEGDVINVNKHYFDLLSILQQLGIEVPGKAAPAGF
ncbi:MAG: hypothetical protein V3U63_06185 [Gemmatimonadota bacterium]